ncbi:hypothetical protein GOBAR_AA08465 [Gossypium barbadense]|uniref:Uncharacterized protein n=1 Tax=Gossypium barbadense TaxID=3634 RepID=A0A2P5Y9H5_GOSBA|nr:hypothetical protein GOBAR_AA08465 [Gossypium barbadense]
MLDRRYRVAGEQISSFNPAYKIHNDCDGTGDIEFDFWSEREACYISPTRRRQMIEEGRKELMEMIRNMPESSYELSLKDLVDKQNSSETVKEKVVLEEKGFRLETEIRTKKRTAKAKAKTGSLSRTASMETDRLLLKMFFPSHLSFKKKSMAENSSKVSPSPSCEGSEMPVDKQWWIKRIFIQRDHKNKEDSCKNSSKSSPEILSPTSKTEQGMGHFFDQGALRAKTKYKHPKNTILYVLRGCKRKFLASLLAILLFQEKISKKARDREIFHHLTEITEEAKADSFNTMMTLVSTRHPICKI